MYEGGARQVLSLSRHERERVLASLVLAELLLAQVTDATHWGGNAGQAVQKAKGKSAFELYTACTAAPIVSCARQIADDSGAGGVACELPSSELGVSESLEEATSCTAQASGSRVQNWACCSLL